jgi:hypothetical protein
MSFTPIQTAAHQKTPFDEVIEKNLATLSDEEVQELRSDQNGEVTEALQLLCKTDSIHLRQSKIRQWNHKLAKYIDWLPAILDILSDPIVLSFPGSQIATGILKAIAKVSITTMSSKHKTLSHFSMHLKSTGLMQSCPIRFNFFVLVLAIFHPTIQIESPATRNLYGSSFYACTRIY